MRINYTMYGTKLTGGVRVIFEIINKLAERGHEMSVTTIGDEQQASWFPLQAKIIGIAPEFKEKLLSKFGYDIVSYHIQKLSNATPDCDINVATFCYTAYAVHRSNKGIPFYHMQHYEKLFFNDTYRKQIAKETYYLPLHKIANSIWLRNKLTSEGLPVDPNMQIVNPAIEHQFFHANYNKTPRKDNAQRIVTLGKDVDWKGLRDLFDAMEIVQQKNKNAKLILFGCDSVSFDTKGVNYECVGRKQDTALAQLYVDADIVITPSWYESFPLPPLEAMACGTPVITTRYGTEDYAVDNENCIVIEPKDKKVMSDAILRLLNNDQLQKKFKDSGPKTAQQYTWNNTADKIEKIFTEAYKQKHS